MFLYKWPFQVTSVVTSGGGASGAPAAPGGPRPRVLLPRPGGRGGRRRAAQLNGGLCLGALHFGGLRHPIPAALWAPGALGAWLGAAHQQPGGRQRAAATGPGAYHVLSFRSR